MKVQLQTNFMGNYGLRSNATQNAGISKINFGTSAMNEFLAVDSANASKLKSAERAQAARKLRACVKTVIKSIRLDEPVAKVGKTTLTAEALLRDLYEETKGGGRLLFNSVCENDNPYLARFKSPDVQHRVGSYVDRELLEKGIFGSWHYPSGYSNYRIYLTELGSAVLGKLFKTAKAAKA